MDGYMRQEAGIVRKTPQGNRGLRMRGLVRRGSEIEELYIKVLGKFKRKS